MSKRFLWLLLTFASLAACEKSYEEPVFPEVEIAPKDELDPWLFKNELDQLQMLPGPEITTLADFGGTRSHLAMNETETRAYTVWSEGDSFKMYGYDSSSNQFYGATFTTSEGGLSADFKTNNALPNSAPYATVYPPAVGLLKSSDGKYLFSVNLPAEQKAVPGEQGGIKDGYAIAYTSANSLNENLHFQSQVSLVRFRMSGSLVSRVKSVSIEGSCSLAGNAIIVVDPATGAGELTQDRKFQNDVQSSTVTLTVEGDGGFVAGKDYYIVVYPGTQPGFMMVFADEEGNSTTKIASEFTFPRSKICDFGVIDLGDEFTDVVNLDPVQYMTATAGTKPVTIAVIPEGFTAKEMSRYEMLAKSGIDALMGTEPFRHYKDYFNVWILKAASNDSGATITNENGEILQARDCFFESKWGEKTYNNMRANDEKVFAFVEEHCPDIIEGIHTISEVPILMIINDSRYGGICWSYGDGKGYGMVPYTDFGGTLSWSYPAITANSPDPLPTNVTGEDLENYGHRTTEEEINEMGRNTGDWRNTLLHEFGGHCFGRLGDEYWSSKQWNYTDASSSYHGWPVPFSLNLASNPSAVPWKADLMDRWDDLVGQDENYRRIGIFQGGDEYVFGRWRSEIISCMIDNRYYFSTWQRMLIVKRIMDLSGSSFDAESFWENDNTIDPVRDVVSGRMMGSHPLPVREVPLLPPPGLVD